VATESSGRLRLAVVGGGWAGLATAVRAVEAGHEVAVFEMAMHWGGRARSVEVDGRMLDNGQHILIGAYARTLALLQTVGADAERLMHRQPLELRYPDGRGLRMPAAPAWLGFGWAVARCVGWSWRDRLALLAASMRWLAQGFDCAPATTVQALGRGLPAAVRELLIDPLCVAALNTPASDASGRVFLRVLRDALFGGRGSADLLLPRRPLGEFLPEPAVAWLAARGARLHVGRRVAALVRPSTGVGWQVDGEAFDAVVLACSAPEAARLAKPHAVDWAELAAGMAYAPIVTVYLQSPGTELACAMTALLEGPDAPAQFVFDHGALGGHAGSFAFVVSGAGPWVARGLEATGEAVLRQATRDFPPGTWSTPPRLFKVLAEKRATFRCTPDLSRPPTCVAPDLVAAGDHVQGPYPATLEGAVRSAELALAALRAPAR
jgi:hydroxysqualene dehydroxylase